MKGKDNELLMRLLVGLTGQTGAGKSTVSDYLRGKGHVVIDADEVARDVAEKGSRCLAELVLVFGIEILQIDGTLNRARAAEIIFSDREKRKAFNQIVFPFIQEEIFSRVGQLHGEGARVVFLDAPTLIESGAHERCDIVVSIIADAETRLARILRRDALARPQAQARMGAQHGDSFYTSRSKYVIVNDGDLSKTLARVDEVVAEILATLES